MKRSLLFLCLLCSISLSAQPTRGFKSVTEATRTLLKPLEDEEKDQWKLNKELLKYGDYELREGRPLNGYYAYYNLALWDNSTGKYIFAPATEKEIKQYKKKRRANSLPAGTMVPTRILFMDSEKGVMAGCPERFNGCLWIESEISEPWEINPKKTVVNDHVGIYRIENGQLKEIVSLPLKVFTTKLNAYHYDFQDTHLEDYYTVNSNMDLFKVVNEYALVKKTLRMQSESIKRGESAGPSTKYSRYWEYTVYDWDGKEIGTYDMILKRGEGFWLRSNGKWALADKQMKQIDLPYDNIAPVETGYFDPPAVFAQKDSLWGLLDKEYNVLIPLTYKNFKGDVYTGIHGAASILPRVCYSRWYKGQLEKYSVKGEFEKEEQFQARMATPELQAEYVETQLGNLMDAYVSWLNINIRIYGTYDSEKEVFHIEPCAVQPDMRFPDGVSIPIGWRIFELPVPIADAQRFKEEFDNIKADALASAKVSLRGDVYAIDEITFTLDDSHTYTYKY